MGAYWRNIYVLGGYSALPQQLFFDLDLRRASISEDTFEKLGAVCHSNYKRPLLVNLIAIALAKVNLDYCLVSLI